MTVPNRLVPITALSALAALSIAAAPASAATGAAQQAQKTAATKTCHNASGHKVACAKAKNAAQRGAPAKTN